MAKSSKTTKKTIDTLKHTGAQRTNIPTAEYEAIMQEREKTPIRVAYERRNRDLDPQLVWRGKDEQDWSDLVVHAPPLYIQEKVHSKVLIDDLVRQTKERAEETTDAPSLFADFNGHSDPAKSTEFYSHHQNWTNRMILGDSLQVMASLAERERLRGQVQCIYIDPPYGIKFNSNFQWSTTSRDVRDGKADHITREPEQVKAFRDTWRDGIHSYLTYLRDRLTVARDLLHESGSIFVQIGDENVHRVRALMDEVFGEENFITILAIKTTTGRGGALISEALNFVLWAAKSRPNVKYRGLLLDKESGSSIAQVYTLLKFSDGQLRRMTAQERDGDIPLPQDAQVTQSADITSTRPPGENDLRGFEFHGRSYAPGKRTFTSDKAGMTRLAKAGRLWATVTGSLRYLRGFDDFPAIPITNVWGDVGTGSFTEEKVYIVQTNTLVVQRCLLMTTDPGDLVLDPTCGSGTTAHVAEQWGRRWITIDTSRVALALARCRIMGARYPYYLLSDTPEGLKKEAAVRRTFPKERPTKGDIRHGFVYERVPHITLKSIANNAEIDVIWEKWQESLEPLREKLNKAAGSKWEEWEIPREPDPKWKKETLDLHSKWWEARIARQKEIDASIAARAEFEYLFDKPYTDNSRVRVAGPFTVESVSPHRMVMVEEDGSVSEPVKKKIPYDAFSDGIDFAQMVLENLKTSGVQQADKADRITFNTLAPWPGEYIAAEGYYLEGEKEKRAGIFIGPEFGTVARPDLVAAAREAADAGFEVLVACAFNYDAHSSEFSKLGKIPVLKARMNPDLHMSADLKNTGHGNLFVVFGEPDVEPIYTKDGKIQLKIKGVDVFKPQTGEIESGGPESIALWFVDTDYNEESFFVRQAYFLGANDPYSALKSTLKAEIDETAWETLYSDISRPFDKPKSGRFAVKVINHLGDEVMKVFKV